MKSTLTTMSQQEKQHYRSIEGAACLMGASSLIYLSTHSPIAICALSALSGFIAGAVAKNIYVRYSKQLEPARRIFLLQEGADVFRLPLLIVAVLISYKFLMFALILSAVSGWMTGVSFRAEYFTPSIVNT